MRRILLALLKHFPAPNDVVVDVPVKLNGAEILNALRQYKRLNGDFTI